MSHDFISGRGTKSLSTSNGPGNGHAREVIEACRVDYKTVCPGVLTYDWTKNGGRSID
jgi:hypothetical protein